MHFLLPVGGVVDHHFGILTSPAHRAIPKGIRAGMRWGGENQAFTKGFDPERFFGWVRTMEPYREQCLFIPPPDIVGNAIATLTSWRNWIVRFDGWPLAFVAQDGQEDLPFPDPDTFSTLFIGGSTDWKLSQAAVDCIKRAQRLGKHIHIGRVNWGRRYRIFRVLDGSNKFTCDGTRTRFDGVDNTINSWLAYQAQPPLITI
jgi:hypothetical protein